MKRVGVDVGGTFTDLILVDEEEGKVVVHKLPTTPADPSRGTLQGVEEVCRKAAISSIGLDQLFHGTTIATNILLEHNGARVGLITTKGFRDTLHIARHKKPYNFSLYQDVPWQTHPLVQRRHRLPVTERVVPPQGEVLIPLNEEEVRAAARRLKEEGLEAVAVCFLFSFLNPAHERRVRDILLEELPQAFLSLRSEVAPTFREYESFSTTAVNAYLGPKVSFYIGHLASTLKEQGIPCEVRLMQSQGGAATPEAASERPVSIAMSGPVAGLVGGIWAGRLAGFSNVITLDVGGTSADIGVAPRGETRMRHLLDCMAGGYHLTIPMVDVDTIGAGGGSLAYVDAGGIFRVGPKSAGADPGPACYGRGGERPTATDAQLVLGRLSATTPFAGGIALREEQSRRAIEEHLCRPLGMGLEEAAMGVLQILVHQMVQSIELNSVRRGYDPRDFALVGFGGAGPLFACDIAREISIPTVLVPPYPGITSAMGLLATDISYEYMRTVMQKSSHVDLERIGATLAELEEKAFQRLREDGLAEEAIALRKIVDCRYLDQGYELRIPAPAGSIDGSWGIQVANAFHQAHEREYGHQFPQQEVQIVNLRVIGVGRTKPLTLKELPDGGPSSEAALQGRREVCFAENGALRKLLTPCYNRSRLAAGNRIPGPAIIEQEDSTTVLNPGLEASVDRYGNLIIR